MCVADARVAGDLDRIGVSAPLTALLVGIYDASKQASRPGRSETPDSDHRFDREAILGARLARDVARFGQKSTMVN